MTLFRDQEYLFDQIRPLLPPDAAAVIEDQRRRIQSAIAAEVDQFRDKLAEYVKTAVEAETRRQQVELVAARDAIKAGLDKLGTNNSKLEAATAKLKAEIDAYEEKWRGLGESAANLVKSAVCKATGVSL
jgi:predicted nuclease with TOPRIM domain